MFGDTHGWIWQVKTRRDEWLASEETLLDACATGRKGSMQLRPSDCERALFVLSDAARELATSTRKYPRVSDLDRTLCSELAEGMSASFAWEPSELDALDDWIWRVTTPANFRTRAPYTLLEAVIKDRGVTMQVLPSDFARASYCVYSAAEEIGHDPRDLPGVTEMDKERLRRLADQFAARFSLADQPAVPEEIESYVQYCTTMNGHALE